MIVAEVFCQNGERQLRRPASAIPPFEASRAVVAERPARVEGLAIAVSDDDADDTSLRTPAAGVHLSAARAAFGSFGQRVHCSPFSWVRKPRPQAASRRRGKGAAPPDCACYGWLPLSPGARRERSRDGPCGGGSASGSASVHLFRPGTAMYWPLPAWRCCQRLFAAVFGERPVALSRNHGHNVSLLSNYRPWRSELCCAPRS